MARLSEAVKPAAGEALKGITYSYLILSHALTPTNQSAMTSEDAAAWEQSEVKPRIAGSQLIIRKFVSWLLTHSDFTIAPAKNLLWKFEYEPRSLIHQICLDFVFDLVHTSGGRLKPCANSQGRKPCPRFVRLKQKYCSKKCKNAVGKRAQRIREFTRKPITKAT